MDANNLSMGLDAVWNADRGLQISDISDYGPQSFCVLWSVFCIFIVLNYVKSGNSHKSLDSYAHKLFKREEY